MRTMMPYDTYRLYQVERSKSPREIQRADEHAALLAAAVSGLFRAVARPAWAARGQTRPPATTVHPAWQSRPAAAPQRPG